MFVIKWILFVVKYKSKQEECDIKFLVQSFSVLEIRKNIIKLI